MHFHSAGHRAGYGDLAHPRPIHEDSTCALLRQGAAEGWSSISYQKVANYFDKRDPIACLFWEREAKRCSK